MSAPSQAPEDCVSQLAKSDGALVGMFLLT